MNAVERNLVWLGVEDYTGLWDASLVVSGILGAGSIEDAREHARRVVESMLDKGWVELYVCQEPLDNDSIELVPPGDRHRILESDSAWEIPEAFGKSVRFAATDEGVAAYENDAE